MPAETVVREMVEAFNRDDVDGVLAAFAEDCAIEEPPEMPDSPVTGYVGHDGVRTWMGNLRAVAAASFELRSAALHGEALLCELVSRGIGRGSEVPIEWLTFAVFDMHGDRIARIRVFLSRDEALAAVG